MNEKRKKFFKRIGAGVLLGLSVFGFGAGARSGQIAQAPKRVRNIRQREEERVSEKKQALLSMLEEEAKNAMNEEQFLQERQEMTQTQQAKSLEQLSLREQIFRFSILAVWTISAGIFFTSLIFNNPFQLGKRALSVLPGNPHTAVLRLEISSSENISSETTQVLLLLDSDKEIVDFVKAVLVFDKNKIDYWNYAYEEENYSEMEVVEKQGSVLSESILEIIARPKEVAEFQNKKVIQLDFKTKQAGEIALISIDRDNSLVISSGEKGAMNILGKTSGLKFLTKNQSNKNN